MKFIGQKLKQANRESILASIFAILLGFIMVIFPSEVLDVISYLIGGILIITGIVKMYYYFKYQGKYNIFNYDLSFGIFSIIFGILCIVFKGELQDIFRIFIGIFVIYEGIIKISLSTKLNLIDTSVGFLSFLLSIMIIICGIYVYKNILINIPTYAYRIRGMQKLFDIMKNDTSKLMFGISNIAYADTGYDYTINMRNFLGWDASIEMAYVNILIKNGLIGILIYCKIFKDILNKAKYNTKIDKNIVISIILVMLLSGFTETYIASIHYVVGPVLFCLINGIIFTTNQLKDKNSIKINE